MKRIGTCILVAFVLAASYYAVRESRPFRRQLAARSLYDHAIGSYMLKNEGECEATFQRVAREYSDMPIGALAELKCAFLVYDRGDRQRAAEMFRRYLANHPSSVMYSADDPAPEYEGELELVAYYFLGRISLENQNLNESRMWFEKILQHGSRNPANLIVGETTVQLRRLNESGK